MESNQYIKVPIPFEVGKTYPLSRNNSILYTVTKIVMCTRPELGISFFMGRYDGDTHESMLHAKGIVPEYETSFVLPDDNNWYFCYLGREKKVLKYIQEDNLWWSMSGDCFTPAQIKWINDKKNNGKAEIHSL